MHEVVIIGGGPSGLTAGMYCRMRKMDVVVVDAGRMGGQLISLYGDKPVHDWPGYHHVIAGQLAHHLIEHAKKLGVEMVDHHKVLDLVDRGEEGFEVVAQHAATREERRFPTKAVIVAIGGGAFEPRRLRVPGEEGLSEDVLTYRMPDKNLVRGRKVIVIGGGDSGLESAQTAHEAGAEVTILQVLERFTGMEGNIDIVDEMKIARHFNTRVRAIETKDGRIEAVVAAQKGDPEPLRLPCDYLVVNIGAAVNLDAVKRWGIEIEGNLIKVDDHMMTSVKGIFACGDIVTYEGKYKLLITASGDGAVAANSVYMYVRKPGRMTMGDLYT